MDTKKLSPSNNTTLIFTLIIIPVLFIFGTMIIIAMIMSANRPNIKLTITEATNITGNSATLSFTIEGDKDKINEKGFVYNTSSNPKFETTSQNVTPFYDLFGGSNYSRNEGNYVRLDNQTFGKVENLYPNTTYYVKAYTITRAGVMYSNEVSFTTLDNPVENDIVRERDVNAILDYMLVLKDISPYLFSNTPGLATNIRVSGSGPCSFSTVKEFDTLLFSELVKLNYIVPTDPNTQSQGCSDYVISINPYDDIITITAPNASYAPISVSSISR